MKHYPNINMETGGNHDFPRLARESGFYFNLYRGRVDWKQIDSLDIDRLIRERDLESLQAVFSSISSCNLTNEYDVKVLDPNFVKLFRLSQLSVDYLQYCRNYLDHCVIVLQEQLRIALHEIEQLQQERQSKEEQVKQLTRKLKDKTKLCGNNGVSTHIADFGPAAVPGVAGLNSGFSQASFRCAPCKKIFVNAIFLQRHIMRRHPEQVKLYSEAESLRLEVQQLQERLQKAEELLKQSNSSVGTEKRELSSKQEKETRNKSPKHEKVDRAQNTDEDLGQYKDSQDNTLKQSEQSEENIRALIENVKRQNEEIEALKNQLKSQHCAQESLWQSRLDQLEQRHNSDINGLRTSLSQPNSITTLSASTSQLSNQTSKELHEKKVQSSPPEMVIKGTQVETTPDRILPPPVQDAFTKPATPPNLGFSSASPKASSFVSQGSVSPVRTESSNVLSNQRTPEGRQLATWQRPQIPRKEQPSVPESQSFSRMSGDVSLTETSSEESSDSSRGTPPQRNESDTDESSSTTENGIKKLSSLATQPQVFTPLRADIEGVMYRLLRELGIDPEWKGIPNATFQSIKANLQHQRAITQKGRRSLVKLRDELSREVDTKAQDIYSSGGSQKDKPPVREAPARPPPPRRSPNKQENEYTAEPRRGRPSKPSVVYEEVKNQEEGVAVPKNDEQFTPVPPARRRSVEKPSSQTEKTAAPVPVSPGPVPVLPVPPPRVTPTTAELLADMEKLRQQGSFLRSEGSFTTKSNLKSTPSTGTGSSTKKRVAFMDEKDGFPTADLTFHDDELGLFQNRDSANGNSSYLNKDHSFGSGSISHVSSSNFDNFSTNGAGEPTESAKESKVSRIAREIESQLMNKPRYPSRPTHLSTFDRNNSELDLILDDLSSS